MRGREGKGEGKKGNESCHLQNVIGLHRLDESSSKLFEEKHADAVAQSFTIDPGANKEACPLESTKTDGAKLDANLDQGDVIMYTRKRKLRSHRSESRDSDNSLETCAAALEDKVTPFEFAVEALNPNFTYIEPETKMTEDHDGRKKNVYDTSMAGANKEAYPLESTTTDSAEVNANLDQGDVIMYTRKRKLRSHSSESRDPDNYLETCATALEDKVTPFEFAIEARNPNFTYIQPGTKMTQEHGARKKNVYDTSMAGSDFEPVAERSSHSVIVVSAEETPSKGEGSCLQHYSPAYAEIRHSKKKLIILDINGLLADIVTEYPPGYRPDRFLSRKAVFKRPFCGNFLRFCFETFDVGVWSSRTKRNVDMVVDFLLGRSRRDLVFCWDQSHCTNTGYHTIDNKDKPLVLKELKEIWNKIDPGKYNESNTLLLDDSPYKALRNPPNTAIFPPTYRFEDVNDRSLGPGGDLRVYLEGLASAENVQIYVGQNPFGQQAITESDPYWNFYSRVLGIERQQPEYDM